MHLDPHVRALADQLAAAAALGDERTQQVAHALAAALDPATRLALVGALGEAADEITAALLAAPGAPRVSTRLDGDEIHFDLHAGADAPSSTPPTEDGEPTARISLRLTENLKTQVDEAAAGEGVSVNTWLTRAATRALGSGRGGATPGGPFAGWSGAGWSGAGWSGAGGSGGGHGGRVTGWIDG